MDPTDGRGGTGVIGEPLAHVSVRRHLVLSFLWFALNFQSAALIPIVLPVQVLLFVSPGAVGSAQQATFLSWTAAGGAVVSIFVPPLAGALSDHTPGPWGRRRPYIFGGALLLVLAAVLLAAPSTAVALVLGLVVFQVGNNVCTAGYQGLLPDLVPEDQRGEASGYIGLMTILGNVLSLGLAAILLGAIDATSDAGAINAGTVPFYALTGIGVAVGALATLVGVHETPLVRSARAKGLPRAGRRERFAADWIAPWRSRNFRWVFLTRASVMLGISLFMTFIEYYLASSDRAASFVQETAALAVLALLGAAASALTLGILSDRIGRVGLVCFATACMAAAAFAFVVLPTGTPLWPLGILFGVGYGAYSSVDWALAVDVLPSAGSFGKDMGLWSIASTLPALLAFLLGGVTLSIAGAVGQQDLGYRVVFALAVLAMVAGAVCILLVQDSVKAREAARIAARGAKPVRRRRIGPGWRLAFRTRGGRARGFLRFWTFWEWVNHLVKHQVAIPGAPHGLLQVEFIRYKWRPITLPDGTRIERGDRVAELHINNFLVAARSADTPTWRLLAMFAADMRALAAWVATDDFPADVRAFYGFTLLNRGAARLGFTLRERPRGIRSRLDGFYMTGTIALFNARGVKRLREGTTYGSMPVEVWMSRDALLRRYALVSSAKS